MKFDYTGRHIEVTPALRFHVENHFQKLDHLFENDNTKAHVIIEVEKGRHRSEIIVKWHEHVLSANSTVSDMYQSLTRTIDKIGKQAQKLKNKVTDKHQRRKKITQVRVEADEIVPEPQKAKIVNVNSYRIKPMTAEEAVIDLNMDENQFVVFRDAESDRFSVIYKRRDGNYGLIQP